MGPSKPPRPHQGATFKGLNANQQAWKGSIRPFPVGADSIQAKPGLVQSIPKSDSPGVRNKLPCSSHATNMATGT